MDEDKLLELLTEHTSLKSLYQGVVLHVTGENSVEINPISETVTLNGTPAAYTHLVKPRPRLSFDKTIYKLLFSTTNLNDLKRNGGSWTYQKLLEHTLQQCFLSISQYYTDAPYQSRMNFELYYAVTAFLEKTNKDIIDDDTTQADISEKIKKARAWIWRYIANGMLNRSERYKDYDSLQNTGHLQYVHEGKELVKLDLKVERTSVASQRYFQKALTHSINHWLNAPHGQGVCYYFKASLNKETARTATVSISFYYYHDNDAELKDVHEILEKVLKNPGSYEKFSDYINTSTVATHSGDKAKIPFRLIKILDITKFLRLQAKQIDTLLRLNGENILTTRELTLLLHRLFLQQRTLPMGVHNTSTDDPQLIHDASNLVGFTRLNSRGLFKPINPITNLIQAFESYITARAATTFHAELTIQDKTKSKQTHYASCIKVMSAIRLMIGQKQASTLLTKIAMETERNVITKDNPQTAYAIRLGILVRLSKDPNIEVAFLDQLFDKTLQRIDLAKLMFKTGIHKERLFAFMYRMIENIKSFQPSKRKQYANYLWKLAFCIPTLSEWITWPVTWHNIDKIPPEDTEKLLNDLQLELHRYNHYQDLHKQPALAPGFRPKAMIEGFFDQFARSQPLKVIPGRSIGNEHP